MLRFDKSVVVTVAVLAAAVGLATGASPSRAGSVPYSFIQLDPGPNVGGSFLMTASEGYLPLGLDDTWVHFNFKHQGTGGAIKSIYFDDEVHHLFDTSVAPILDGTGNVAFSTSGAPPNLPGWDEIDPVFQSTWSFHADSPGTSTTSSTTVLPGEELDIVMKLLGGKTFTNVENALPNELRVGLFVQDAFQDEDMAFVSAKFLLVPLPAAAWSGLAMLAGLGVVAACRHRKHQYA